MTITAIVLSLLISFGFWAMLPAYPLWAAILIGIFSGVMGGIFARCLEEAS